MKTKKILAGVLGMSLIYSLSVSTVSAEAKLLGTDASGNEIWGGIYDVLTGFDEEGKPVTETVYPDNMNVIPAEVPADIPAYIVTDDSESKITDTETIKNLLEKFIEKKEWNELIYSVSVVSSEKNTKKVFVEFNPVDVLEDEHYFRDGEISDYCKKNNIDLSLYKVIMYEAEEINEAKSTKIKNDILTMEEIIAGNGWQDITLPVYYSGGCVHVTFKDVPIGEKENDENAKKLYQLCHEAGIDAEVSVMCDASAVIPNDAGTEVSLGDINTDGKIDISDLSELSLAIIGDKTLSEDQLKASDIDGNGKADLPDLARLRQYLSKVVTALR